jgi:N-acetylglucosaminyldiphosphoundecaprenol N-acetyl-beta-D-mannosaminyltransferase
LPEVALLDVGLQALSEAECVRHVLDRLDEGQGGWLVSQDLDHLRRMSREPGFRAKCERADLRVADGGITLWACRLQRTPVPESVAGASLTWSLARGAAGRGRSVFLLGDQAGTVQRAAEELTRNLEGLRVVGWSAPAEGFQQDPVALKRLAHEIERARPDVVLVGLAAPSGVELMHELARSLPTAWWVGVGRGLRSVSGEHGAGSVLKRSVLGPALRSLPFALVMLVRAGLRGMLPKPRQAGAFGTRRPRALLVDDDPFALSHLELLLHESFPELEIEKRLEAQVQGRFDFYFLDNDFGGKPMAGPLAREIRRKRPEAHIYAFATALDVDALKRLINAGCDGVWEKSRPDTWQSSLVSMRNTMEEMAQRHRAGKRAFGGVRNAAGSIRGLLREWNERVAAPDLVDTEDVA